jgi:hypothetical protein
MFIGHRERQWNKADKFSSICEPTGYKMQDPKYLTTLLKLVPLKQYVLMVFGKSLENNS